MSRSPGGVPSGVPSGVRARFDAFELDLESGELTRHGVAVPLNAQPARALTLLVRRAGRLVPPRDLIDALWPDTIVEYDQSLNSVIRAVRRALGDDAREPRFVATVPRLGYRFLPPVESVAGATPDPPPPRAGRRLPRAGLAAAALLAVAALVASGSPDDLRRAKVLAIEALRLGPESPRAHLLRGWTALALDWDWPVAGRHLGRAAELAPGDPQVHAVRALYLASAGPEVEAAFLRASRRTWAEAPPGALRAVMLASVAARSGDLPAALEHLDEAVRRHSPYAPFLAADPHFEPLHGHPAFERLLATVGHPAASRSAVPAAAGPDDAAPPAWFLEHNEFLARDGGVFHADNSVYRSEAEPWDAYGLAWEQRPTENTLHGRLFGLRDGADVATFWDFFVFWRPGERRAYIYQVGKDGTLGVATLDPPGPDGVHRSEGVIHRVDGSAPPRNAHDARNHGDIHDTRSFDWVDGAWKPRRAYTWKRVK